MTVLQANLRALERIAPKLVERLAAVQAPECWPILGADGLVTPEIDGRLLVSEYDQAKEAARQAGAIATDGHEQTWCYGIGMGALPRALLARPDVGKLVVVCMSLPILRLALELADHTDWLCSGRVLIVAGAELSRMYGPAAVVAGELRHADPACERLRDELAIHLNRRFHRVQFLSQAKNDQAHEQASSAEFAGDENVRDLIEQRRDAIACETFIVVAGGPSLDDEIGWLGVRLASSCAPCSVITVSTSLGALLKAKIVPDYVLVIDPHPTMVDHLEGLDLSELHSTTLVYDRVVTPAFMRRWPGRRAWGTMGTSLELCDLWADGTVTHPAVDLARRLNAEAIVLLGADFCNAYGRTHHMQVAEGAPVEEDGLPTTVDGSARLVTTTPKLTHYRRMLERYIEAFPAVRFFKRGRAGVPLAGATWLD